MYPSLQTFLSGVDGLISHIEFEEAKEEYFKDGLIKYSGRDEFSAEFRFFVHTIISRGATNGKRFLYNSMIVSLYGYLESFLESLVEEYVARLAEDCPSYADIPIKIREQHLELSIDLVKNTRKDRNISKEDKLAAIKRIIGNMNSCINELEDFSLNEDAYSIHTANFRYDSIHNLFERAGVAGIVRLALEKKNLKDEISKISEFSGKVDKKILISLITAELDDLAQRRNEISHGSLNTDLQSFELFRSRANFVRSLGVALHDVLLERTEEFIFPLINKFNLGKPSMIFQTKRVLGFNFSLTPSVPAELMLAVGDEIFSYNERSERKLIVGKVVEIKCDGVDVHLIQFDRAFSITIKVDFKLTSHMASRDIYLRLN
jgi:hypothetical protein